MDVPVRWLIASSSFLCDARIQNVAGLPFAASAMSFCPALWFALVLISSTPKIQYDMYDTSEFCSFWNLS